VGEQAEHQAIPVIGFVSTTLKHAERFLDNVRKVNPAAPIFPISCRTGEGIDAWTLWFEHRVAAL